MPLKVLLVAGLASSTQALQNILVPSQGDAPLAQPTLGTPSTKSNPFGDLNDPFGKKKQASAKGPISYAKTHEVYSDKGEQYDERGGQLQDGNVHLKFWTGRTGNNVKQLVNAFTLAEATGRKKVCMPLKAFTEDPPLSAVFDLPEGGNCTDVREANPSLGKRLKCSIQYTEKSIKGLMKPVVDNFFDPPCQTNLVSDDLRNAAFKNVLPLMNAATQEACAAEGDGFEGLTIHLRSGDLLDNSEDKFKRQGQFAPCAYHMNVINEFAFKSVRLVTEPDLRHPCIAYIKAKASADVNVTVQSGTISQDVCALMKAHNVLHSSVSTFSMVFGWIMNDKLKNTFWPFPTLVPGFVEKDCAATALSDSTCARQTFLYEISDLETPRTTFAEKAQYLLRASARRVKFSRAQCRKGPCSM